jgi:hypothetical protein
VAAKKSVLAAAMTCVLAMGTAGCAGDDSAEPFDGMSGEQIAERSIEAMRGLTSLSLHATNQSAESGGMEMRLSMSRDGRCTGTMSLGEGETELLAVDGESFMKANDEFWTNEAGEADQDMLDLVAGRWIRMPEGEGGLSASCDLKALLTELDAKDFGADTERADGEAIDGTDTVALVRETEGGTRTAYVATTGEPYILRLVTEGGHEDGTAEFSGFDEDVVVEAPAKKDIVDFSELMTTD